MTDEETLQERLRNDEGALKKPKETLKEHWIVTEQMLKEATFKKVKVSQQPKNVKRGGENLTKNFTLHNLPKKNVSYTWLICREING